MSLVSDYGMFDRDQAPQKLPDAERVNLRMAWYTDASGLRYELGKLPMCMGVYFSRLERGATT